MRKRLLCGLLAAAWLAALPGRASDHADPQSVTNPFKVQADPDANITDLHAFVVDREGRLITDENRIATDSDQLIISLCVHRALRPGQVGMLQLKGYKFRVHLDFNPPVRMFDEKAYAERLAKATEAERASVIAAGDADRSMQALYGGIITDPEGITETALLELELKLVGSGATAHAVVTKHRVDGISGPTNLVRPFEKPRPGFINITAGVFDDPFIFPRFFRRNVVGVVTSIPLSKLPLAEGNRTVLLWATTHKGAKQIDHVGRSLRTQLPRFGYLNDLPPAAHVHAITRVHDRPNLMEDVLATVISPLEAHRYYDSTPDVMIYNLGKPAKFPNGRALTDDVSKILADAGETLLLELSYAESRQFPRATTNDKEFRPTFPYLAPPWTEDEIQLAAQPGATVGSFPVPSAPEGSAIAPPTLRDKTWRTFSIIEGIAIALLALFLLKSLRSEWFRIGVVLLTVTAFWLLWSVWSANVYSAPEAMTQPAMKARNLVFGGVVIGLFFVGLVFTTGRRHGERGRPVMALPQGSQGLTPAEATAPGSSYEEVHEAVFSEPYYGKLWPGAERCPIYRQTLGSLIQGLLPFGRPFGFLSAARRTVRSHSDLRWGRDRRGFRRLLHPMGICLAGTWKIDSAPLNANYTGYFAPGAEGRIIARYSTSGSSPRGGNYRSLALVGNIYPPAGAGGEVSGAPATFFTQEDLGSTYTNSIRDAVLTNSPPISPWNRGKDAFQLFFIGATLLLADAKNSERQLYEIAELGKPPGRPTSCPRFMRLTVSDKTPWSKGFGVDFRDEILSILYDPCGAEPTGRRLIFDIAVSDDGEKHGFGVEWLTGQHWTRIGSITFTEAAASYNGDFVIHFHHPPWRGNRNKSASVVRSNLRPAPGASSSQ